MTIVLLSDATLMPDVAISSTPVEHNNAEVVSSILDDLKIEMGETNDDSATMSYVNSLIAEVTVTGVTNIADFKLSLYFKPTTDIVSKITIIIITIIIT